MSTFINSQRRGWVAQLLEMDYAPFDFETIPTVGTILVELNNVIA